MKLLDNKKHGKVGDVVKENLLEGSKVSMISASFSIFAFWELRKELSKINDLRLILTSLKDKTDGQINLLGGEFERRYRNRLDSKKIAKECASWIKKKAIIHSLLMPNSLGSNLTHIENNDKSISIQGGSSFTATGLGFTESDTFDMNTCLENNESTKDLLNWFDSIWENKAAVNDIQTEILENLEKVYSDKSPEFIYFFIIYNIFKDFLTEMDEENIIKSKTGFKDTLVWNKLYQFQKDGVLGAIEKIEKHNGCIIADSVGLGKTFEALAVIKYYELRNDRVLVLCPKKLRDNWSLYTINDKRNLLAGDRFNYDILNHTDLTRTRGKSGEINLETLNWGNYDLIVIDESHNFRNNNARKETITRYSRLMNDVIKAGVKTKVLMLSATPVNNRMNDLKNQVAFITEGDDTKFKTYGIQNIEQSLKKAQTIFNQWLDQDPEERNLNTLLELMNFEYFKLLDLITIARSRKHIEKYYNVNDIGNFPKRLTPKNIKTDIDVEGLYPPLKDINLSIRKLNLSAYSPLKYVKMEKREEYNEKYDIKVKDGASVFRQIDREQSLVHLMRVNLLKRMESSINSFTLTLEKLLGNVNAMIEKLDSDQSSEIDELNINDIEVDSGEFDDFLIGSKVKVLIKDIDAVRWRQELEEDRDRLQELLDGARDVTVERDAKLKDLKALIQEKCTNPINEGNKKIIIFTAFADTANYLYREVAEWAKSNLQIHTALVTGGGTNQSTMKLKYSDLNSLLTSFSPVSKERDKIDSSLTEEIDLLIATDCISEGQNLQDCDFLVNYDIHWNPVRIIQRFGRVDRLGSKNEVIQLVNYWPNLELDEYINLESRVSGRMVLLDISATGEENVIEQNKKRQMNDLEYRRKQLKQLQDSVVDIEDISGGVSITDLTLNDFRMDLTEYMKTHSKVLEDSPFGNYSFISIPQSENDLPEGTVFCLKDAEGKVLEDQNYSLSPYYLVYISCGEEIVFGYKQSKKTLDMLKKYGKTNTGIPNFDDLKADKAFYDSKFKLLMKAASNILEKSESRGVGSLFEKGGTVVSKNDFKGIDDLEVVAWLDVIKGNG
ncbi:helicase [Halobacteriovorax sp. BALOs_7]|uniref:helicase-related protein n=1 Tax=Halobacteriovorax sp. BALOs_7 TaxID=2109558 RepID=UPI000EA02BC8|nr:helicase-related protein [Halobacteriovorax sp. BALOs_7]AYF43707.1 helicase [Halobacteriovorax sp. BALOs_7]